MAKYREVGGYLARLWLGLYPPRCLLCERRGQLIAGRALDLCLACQQTLPFNRAVCARCALPLAEGTAPDRLCGQCQQKPPVYDAALSLFRYEQPLIWLVQQLKFNQRLSHARVLGMLMAAYIQHQIEQGMTPPQAVLPVPLHRRRLRQRGFNQSVELARPLSQACELPLLLDAVKRVRATQAQTGLEAKQRRRNLRGAFEVVQPLPYTRLAIIDDVVTTGSTVNELARVLKRCGVERVEVWSLARAPLGRG